jgi:hypothetical protein
VYHGVIDLSLANLEEAKTLRNQAKAIVESLFQIAEKQGFKIPRDTTYEEAISYNDRPTRLDPNICIRLSGFKSS